MEMKYLKTGNCTFRIGDSLRNQTGNIPSGAHGVYKIYANSKDGELLYIGKSGTFQCCGSFKAQDLKGRLNNKQEGMRREEFFTKELSGNPNIKMLYIEWFIIDSKQYLPGYYEAVLIQEYYQ
ncbi:MAG: hypothetical protein K2O69_04305 [Odoribacter sp.]|nr:hypothetical protein [Odoribacter sp.]